MDAENKAGPRGSPGGHPVQMTSESSRHFLDKNSGLQEWYICQS